jgi:gliding motility-associated-like protein
MLLELIPSHITCQSGTYDNGSVDLTVTGGIAPYIYIWSNGENSEDIYNLTEGNYSVTVTDANGCIRDKQVRINLPPSLTFEKVVSNFNNFNISCYGRSDGSIRINPVSGTPPFTYSWQGPDGFSSTTKDISDLKAGEYVLLITDSNFCTGTENIVLNEPPGEISARITSLNNVGCNGDKSGTITLEAVNNAGNVTYLWSDGALGSTRAGLKAGNYRVIITDSNNCKTDSVITITEPGPIELSFEVTRPFCPDMPAGDIRVNITGGTGPGYSYLWSDNSTDQDLTSVPGGIYSVRITDMNNCFVEKTLILEPVNSFCLQIPNAISPNGDLINDVWNIGMKELYPNMEIKIFNRWGEIVWKSERGYPIPWDGRSKGTMLPVDSYHYIIDLNNGSKPVLGHITIVK